MAQVIYVLLAAIFSGGSIGVALVKAAQHSTDYSQPTLLICLAFVFAVLAVLKSEDARP